MFSLYQGRYARNIEEVKREVECLNRVKQSAYEYLYSQLTKEQYISLRSKGYFTVVGSRGTVFQISVDTNQGNIDVMSPSWPNRSLGTICAHSGTGMGGQIPNPLQFLSQKLAIETDEWAFVETSHHYAGNNIYYGTDGKIYDYFAPSKLKGNSGPGNSSRLDREALNAATRARAAADINNQRWRYGLW